MNKKNIMGIIGIALLLLAITSCTKQNSMKELEAEMIYFNDSEILFSVHNSNSEAAYGAQFTTTFYNEKKEIVRKETQEIPFIAGNASHPLFSSINEGEGKYFQFSVELVDDGKYVLSDYRNFLEFNHNDNGKYIIAQAENTSSKNLDLVSANVTFYKNDKIILVVKNSVTNVRINGNINFVFPYPPKEVGATEEVFDSYEFQLESTLVNLEVSESETDLEIEEILNTENGIYFTIKNHSSDYMHPSLSFEAYDENGSLGFEDSDISMVIEPQGVVLMKVNKHRWLEIEDYDVLIDNKEVAQSSEIELHERFRWSIEDTGEEIVVSSQKIEDGELYEVEGLMVFYKNNEIVEIREVRGVGPFSFKADKRLEGVIEYPFNISFDRYELYWSKISIY